MRQLWLQIQYFFFGNVDKILDNFNKINRKLDKAVEFHMARQEAAIQAERAARQAAQVAEHNIQRAQTVRQNIGNLLGN